MRNMGSKGPIRWRRVAVCASALLMFAVPSVCLAEEAPAVDEAAAIVTEVQEQTQTSVETPSEIPAETPAPDVPPAETEQTSTGGQSPEGEQAFKGDTAADHKQQAKPAPSTEAIPAATPSNSTEQNSSDSDANADTPSDGSDQQDKPLTGVQYVDGDWHYYDESGNPATGWYTWEDGARSYFEDGVAATDWTHIDGKTYYFVQDGEHGCLIWERRIDDKVYYFDGFGVMHTGWLTWKKDAIRSYFGADGAALSGWQTVGGKRYYFDPDNWCHGYRWEHKFGDDVYYFDSDCHMWTGWLTWNKDRTRSYFGSDGAALSGWQTVQGKKYYFDPANWCHGYRWEHRIGGKVYYFDADCHMWTGWLTWKKDSTRSYFGADGAALSGWQTVGGKRYYFDPKNWCHGLRWEHTVGDNFYYFDSDCHMWTGWLTWKKDKTRSYFNTDESSVDYGAMLYGVQTIAGVPYDFGTSGKYYPQSIMGATQTTVTQMVRHYLANMGSNAYPAGVYTNKGAKSLNDFCQLIYEEATAEGVRAEVLYTQVMLETGYLQFGGDVLPEQCNFGGIGATGNGVRGNSFKDVRTGLRAQTQHLKAYASTELLNNACVDPRFSYVKRGCAPTIDGLTGTWAASSKYADSLKSILNSLLKA